MRPLCGPAKVVVRDDPRPLIASYPGAIQKAIAAGKIAVGMTKQQAILSLGYPPTDVENQVRYSE